MDVKFPGASGVHGQHREIVAFSSLVFGILIVIHPACDECVHWPSFPTMILRLGMGLRLWKHSFLLNMWDVAPESTTMRGVDDLHSS